jgi:hypothetical protein
MINLTTNEAKNRYHRQHILTSISLEQYGTRLIAPILGRSFLDAARLLEWGITNFTGVVENNNDRLINALLNLDTRTGTIYSDMAFDAFEDVFGKTYAEVPLTRGMKEDYWGAYGVWSKREAAKKIVKINDTTRESIRTILEKGRADGKSYRMIAKDMRNVSPLINRQRAFKIARTEIHTASVFSTDESFRHTNVEFEREWHSIIDERTRGLDIKDLFSHVIANGEVVAQDGKFIRTGESLDYPGDPKGSPANIIFCRCILLYHALKRVLTQVSKPLEMKPEITNEYQSTDSFTDAITQFRTKLNVKNIKTSGYVTKKEKMSVVNKTGDTISDIYNKFPKIGELARKGKDLDTINIKNSKNVGKNRLGYYTSYKFNRGPASITMAGSNNRKVDFIISKGFDNIENHISLDYESVLRHELGHHTYNALLDRKDVVTWSKFYSEKKRAKIKGEKIYWSSNISWYSSTNEREGFSECFSLYTSPLYDTKKEYKLPKEIEDIMEKVIGKRKI